jgi:hypothetical protein
MPWVERETVGRLKDQRFQIEQTHDRGRAGFIPGLLPQSMFMKT